LLALAAPLDPEKVQLLALLARLGASVMAGSATGDAIADTAHVASARDPRILDIVVLFSGSTASCSPWISVLVFGFPRLYNTFSVYGLWSRLSLI
jgi:hypothetical protein